MSAPTDLGEVIPATLAALPDPARAHWEIDPEARMAHTDAGLLDRVLGNIAENALRYQRADTPRSRCGTSRVPTGSRSGWWTTAPACHPANRSGSSGPSSATTTSAATGSVSGLAVARGLAEAMGGRVGAEPTPGGWTDPGDRPAHPAGSGDPG